MNVCLSLIFTVIGVFFRFSSIILGIFLGWEREVEGGMDQGIGGSAFGVSLRFYICLCTVLVFILFFCKTGNKVHVRISK